MINTALPKTSRKTCHVERDDFNFFQELSTFDMENDHSGYRRALLDATRVIALGTNA